MKFLSRFRKPKFELHQNPWGANLVKLYELKNILPPQRHGKSRHLKVVAATQKEALLMRKYLEEEGFEG